VARPDSVSATVASTDREPISAERILTSHGPKGVTRVSTISRDAIEGMARKYALEK